MITSAVVFDHRNRAASGKEGAVEIRITHNRKAYYVNTGVMVLRKEFVGGTIVDRQDSKELNERIRAMTRMGITVLIVEHDMAMVMSIADRIHVINSGKYLAGGTAEEIANNQAVIEAYLGRGDI
jgi:branched-chain amino acid transport system ATP-binding protein